MAERRPDPDELLREIQAQDERAQRGKLKIFLGASAGVGKTYSMLSEAHEQRNRGVDVAAGYVETHGRKETEALLRDLEIIPLKELEYKGVALKEFDVDAALNRKPALVIVDELAHTNVRGSRHRKRFQDVEELLNAGIDVYTAINIQHLESLNDVVAQITGVSVSETVPDSVFTDADEVELVDIAPKELIQRLQEGKVYLPDQVKQAVSSFFREGNLIALRELALRKTADRVDAQMQSYRAQRGVDRLWPTKERILVCVAPNRMATRLVRTARRMADSIHGEVIALCVQSDRQSGRSPEQLEKARRAMQLAESLGMETVNLSGHDIVGEVLRFANQRNVSQIIVGKPIKPRWKEVMIGSVVDELVRRSGDINVHVITGEAEQGRAPRLIAPKQASTWQSYAATVVVTGLATGLCFLLFGRFDLSNLVMVYLLGVAIVSSKFGPREALLSATLSVGAFDFFFVPPRFTFSVSDTQYVLTFGVMLVVALLISSLTQAMRHALDSASARERRTAALYALSRKLAKSRSKREIAESGCASIQEVLDCLCAVYVEDEKDSLTRLAEGEEPFSVCGEEEGVLEWAFRHSQPAGIGTDTLPSSEGLYIPLVGTSTPVGVLAIKPREGTPPDMEQTDLLSAFANQIGSSLERAILAKESQNARLQVEAESLKNSLLSSVSHDLRSPLTSIAGAASSLLTGDLPEERKHELATTIYEESDRLNRLVRNLLDMTRLESGGLQLNQEWHSLEELIGSAVKRTERLKGPRKLRLSLEGDLPLVFVDGLLVEQVLVNLLENEFRHTPDGAEIEVVAQMSSGFVRVEVSDNGPGLQKGDEDRIFEKFYKGSSPTESMGFGLGLAIARSILKAHGAQIWARSRPGGGVLFIFELKAERSPAVPVET